MIAYCPLYSDGATTMIKLSDCTGSASFPSFSSLWLPIEPYFPQVDLSSREDARKKKYGNHDSWKSKFDKYKKGSM